MKIPKGVLREWKNSEAESEDYSDADDERDNEEERHKEAVEVDDWNRADMQLSKKVIYIIVCEELWRLKIKE